MGEVDGHKGVAVILHVVVHAETSPVMLLDVTNLCGGGVDSFGCKKKVRIIPWWRSGRAQAWKTEGAGFESQVWWLKN